MPSRQRLQQSITICVSALVRAASFKSREDHRKQIELEEARKAGLAPAEVDEDGKEINPHIPQYMSSAPWYLNADKPVSLLTGDFLNQSSVLVLFICALNSVVAYKFLWLDRLNLRCVFLCVSVA